MRVKTDAICSGRRGINEGFLYRLLVYRPEINTHWLLSGEGAMFRPAGVDRNSVLSAHLLALRQHIDMLLGIIDNSK